MDRIMSPEQVAEAFYGEATDAAKVTIRRQCADGTIRHAEKDGSRWYINATREWPKLFPPESPQPEQARREPVVITGDTTLRELVEVLGALAGAMA